MCRKDTESEAAQRARAASAAEAAQRARAASTVEAAELYRESQWLRQLARRGMKLCEFWAQYTCATSRQRREEQPTVAEMLHVLHECQHNEEIVYVVTEHTRAA